MIEIKLFAQIKETAGKSSISLDIENITIGQLKEILEQEYEFPSLDHLMIAVNEEYADDNRMICSGDTIALIPMVSGG